MTKKTIKRMIILICVLAIIFVLLKVVKVQDIILKNTLVIVSNNLKDYELYKDKVIYFIVISNNPNPSYKKGLRVISKDTNLLEYIENLLSIDKLNYVPKNSSDLVSKSKYYFQEKMKLNHSNLPKDDFLLELYKNARNTSSYPARLTASYIS